MNKPFLAFLCAVWLPAAVFAYDYGADEFVTIQKGMSPDRKYAITAHGGSENREERFHIYLHNAVTGKKIGPLEEINKILDGDPGSYVAQWSKDSQEVTIVWRFDRQEPLQAVTYQIANGRAKAIKGPGKATNAQGNLWAKLCGANPEAKSEKTWGTPLAQ